MPMYKILTDQNVLLGYADKPCYIKQTGGGVMPCAPVEATGLNFQGVIYNLLGHSEIEGAPTAYASMVTETELLQILNSGTTSAVNAVNIMLGEA